MGGLCCNEELCSNETNSYKFINIMAKDNSDDQESTTYYDLKDNIAGQKKILVEELAVTIDKVIDLYNKGDTKYENNTAIDTQRKIS